MLFILQFFLQSGLQPKLVQFELDLLRGKHTELVTQSNSVCFAKFRIDDGLVTAVTFLSCLTEMISKRYFDNAVSLRAMN